MSDFESALSVNDGVVQPPPVSEESVQRFKQVKRKRLNARECIEGILAGNRIVLSQAITMVESNRPDHQEVAQQIIEACLPYSGNSVRIGITGVPGVGKSTFIEALGVHLTNEGHKLAVLAIDPSSERSKGSILGDKTRMEKLSISENAFIRPSPSAGSLGGVARKTRETVILCEAAGFDTIFIETVGVGQSETAVHSMVDFFLLLMLSGAGDELQGIKRGIMEMADAIAITKADGANTVRAEQARVQYNNALHLFPLGESKWTPTAVSCSAVSNEGIDKVWNLILDYHKHTNENGYFQHRRNSQSRYWMLETINESLMAHFYRNEYISNQLDVFEELVLSDKMSSFVAARRLLDQYFQTIEKQSIK
jgi:LAO/AO transport system kinase